MKSIYIGPSWAERSFNTPDDTDTEITSIAKELDLDIVNLAQGGYSNRMLLQKLQSYLEKNPQFKGSPIIWFYSEPFMDAWWYENCDGPTFLQSQDWMQIRSSTNQKIPYFHVPRLFTFLSINHKIP